MAILTAQDFADQMIAQLRVLDPSVSAEIGTPERKIIDTVAQALSENQVDLTGLGGALDIDSKFGTNLDRFTQLFGFQRQQAVVAKGFVIFSRNTPAPEDILIPAGSAIQANTPVDPTGGTVSMQYTTTAAGSIPQGETDSNTIPVSAVTTGTGGNAGANTLTIMVGTPVAGTTSVTNPNTIGGGLAGEDDNSYKIRFKNTVFRNLAGTEDQYLALSLSTPYSTKANVIGPVSKYQEYAQVPDFDDAGFLNGVLTSAQNEGGIQGQWTSALSSIPYAQDIWSTLPAFISNGQVIGQYFFRPGQDFVFNYPPYHSGDWSRIGNAEAAPAPNFTFLNVYNPATGTPLPGLQAMSPGDLILTEFQYLSSASRNSIVHNVLNAVDVYIDGSNPVQSSSIFLVSTNQFTTQSTDALYVDNYRRDGQPAKRPSPGNFFTPLYQSPLTSLPSTITVGLQNYYLNVHYWLVHEVTQFAGSIRSRDGIEWSSTLGADAGGQVPPLDGSGAYDPLASYLTTGNTLNTLAASTNIEVDNYFFDANVVTLQAALEAARQITTDVLAHHAKIRYFKLDVTVMYGTNANYAVTNSAIGTALQAFMQNQLFGSVIQLSDLLDVVHQTSGIDNVRWTNDLPNPPNLIRVIETDINGNPLQGVTVDRTISGTSISKETQTLYIDGAIGNAAFGSSDSFQLTWTDSGTYTTAPISLASIGNTATTATAIQTAINTALGGAPSPYTAGVVVIPDFVPGDLVATHQSYRIVFNTNGTPVAPTVTQNINASAYAYNSDFFLQDNELPSLPTGQAPGDTVPGVIVRPRAQNSFVRPGVG